MKIKEKVHLENLITTLEASLSRLGKNEQDLISKKLKLEQNLEQIVLKKEESRRKISEIIEKLNQERNLKSSESIKKENSSPTFPQKENCRRMFELYKSQGLALEDILGLLEDFPEGIVKEVQKEF